MRHTRDGGRRILLTLLAVALVLVPASPAGAHAPVFFWQGRAPARQPYTIPDVVGRAMALYGQLAPGGEHHYTFRARAGEPLLVDLLAPPSQRARVSGVLVLPGGEALPLRPVREPVFEVFTQMRLMRVAHLRLRAPAGGRYRVRVYAGEALTSAGMGARGAKYVLATGENERFGPADLFKTPLWWLQAHLWLWQ